MKTDSQRVVLKNNGKIFVDDADTNWRWVKSGSFHPQYKLFDEKGVNLLSHFKRKWFVLMVLDFHNGCGEFG